MNKKRITLFTASLLLVVGAALVVTLPPKADPEAPRFIRGQIQPAAPFTSIHYGWSELVPFAGKKVWLWTASGTNHHCYWYDLDKRTVIGELLKAGPVFCNADETKLLCQGHDSLETSFKQKLADLGRKIFGGKAPIPKLNRADTYWVLDLRNNSVKRMGELSQIPGTGSTWRPSPGFRYGCNVPSNSEEGTAFFICDLETGVFRKIRFRGDLQGWWDETRILIRDPGDNFVLLDILSGNTSTLFSAGLWADTLREKNLTNFSGRIRAINNWNGSNYDFYFGLQNASYQAGASFLFKANHEVPVLKLLFPNFKFEHLGRLDASASHYLYGGEPGLPGRGGNGAVLLRDLSNNSVTTLVPPDNRGQYSLPRFYGDEVVYIRNRMLWRMSLTAASNNAPVLSTIGP